MTTKLSARERNLAGVFSGEYAFEIPVYQRPYAWQAENALQLLDDVLDVLANAPDDTSLEEVEPYFLGSIVLIKEREDRPDCLVVDGQQRLTTLTMLLAVLRDAADDDKFAHSLQRLIYQQRDELTGEPARFRLLLRKRDRDFFRDTIQLPAATLSMDARGAEMTDSQRRIHENGLEQRARVEAMPVHARRRLASFLAQRCFLVVVTVADQDSAYRIFSVLNDRGLELGATDILKADIIGGLATAGADEAKYNEIWEAVEDELGRERFEDLFSHIRAIFAKKKQQGTLPKEFREYVLKQKQGVRFIEQVLRPYARWFEGILDRDLALNGESGAAVRRHLRALDRLDNRDWVPPALAFLHKRQGDPSGVRAFLAALERLAYSLFLRRAYPTERILRYAEILAELDAGVDVLERGRRLDLDTPECIATLEALNGPIYLTPRLRLPILLRLDELLSGGEASYEVPTITVEHILPQQPSSDSPWLENFPDSEERERLVHTLGNLALLDFRKNSSAGNLPFTEKKEAYFFRRGETTPFVLTNELRNIERWTPDVLYARQSRLVGVLRKAWRLAA